MIKCLQLTQIIEGLKERPCTRGSPGEHVLQNFIIFLAFSHIAHFVHRPDRLMGMQRMALMLEAMLMLVMVRILILMMVMVVTLVVMVVMTMTKIVQFSNF